MTDSENEEYGTTPTYPLWIGDESTQGKDEVYTCTTETIDDNSTPPDD